MTAVVVGIDEAGRGPLAGPVVAGACVLTTPLFRRRAKGIHLWSPYERKPENDTYIADSKSLDPEERETAFAWITANCPYGYGMSSAEEIDAMGILAATEKAMNEAVTMLEKVITPTYLVVDGRDGFWFNYPHSSVVRGDQTEPCIAAASIIAKVTRDRWICEAAKKHPEYGFEQHKGYGTPVHQAALLKHGLCPLHRRSFVKSFLQTTTGNIPARTPESSAAVRASA